MPPPAPTPPGRARLLSALLFGGLALLGLLTFRDYGMAWDDFLMRTELAIPLFRFLGDPLHVPLSLGLATYHGPALEMVETGLERLLGLEEPRTVFLYRHLFMYAVFLAGLWGLYRASRRWFPDPSRALLPVVFLVLQPRIYADAFYNGKDVGFLAVLCLALWTGERFRERPADPRRLLVHAFACGFLVGVRVIGLALPFADFCLVLLPGILAAAPAARRRAAGAAAVFTAATYAFTVLCWPSLWIKPVRGLWEAVADNARFSWKGAVLYGGRYLPADRLPWHYLPRWIGITTPLALLALGAAGAAVLAVKATRRNDPHRGLLPRLMLVCLPAPFIAIALRSTLYDGWRHFYYLSAPLAVCAAWGFWAARDALALRAPRLRMPFAGAVACLLGVTAVEMAVLHPYQNLYFNELLGRDWSQRETRYEMDYWGLTYLEALRGLLALDPAPRLKVWATTADCAYSANLLTPAERARLQFLAKPEGADYLITNYRWRPAGFTLPEVYAVKIYGARVISILKAPPVPPAAPAAPAAPPG